MVALVQLGSLLDDGERAEPRGVVLDDRPDRVVEFCIAESR